MKKVTVVMDGDLPMIHTHGEVLFDASESSLIVSGESGAYINFNWDKIAYYSVSPMTDEEGHHAGV